jgi:hypothetical protein
MKYFLYGFGVVVLICLVFAALLYSASSLMFWGAGFSEHTLDTLQETKSPNGTYVATSYSDMGGGAAGWCVAEVNVRKVGTELPPNEEIFAAHCGTKVELVWNSDDQLTIKFTPDDIDFGVTQFATSKDGSVRLKYIEGKPLEKNSNRATTQ